VACTCCSTLALNNNKDNKDNNNDNNNKNKDNKNNKHIMFSLSKQKTRDVRCLEIRTNTKCVYGHSAGNNEDWFFKGKVHRHGKCSRRVHCGYMSTCTFFNLNSKPKRHDGPYYINSHGGKISAETWHISTSSSPSYPYPSYPSSSILWIFYNDVGGKIRETLLM
jgi:hypothetical protein